LSLTDLDLPTSPTGEIPHVHSHRHLVEAPALRAGAPAALGAVVVPATRPNASLTHAAGVAARAGCPLVVLCSKGITAADAVATVRRQRRGARVVAVDVGGHDTLLGVRLRTGEHHLATRGRGDASHKRNVGLLLARMLGWDTVLFLDDDVVGMDAEPLARTRGLLASETTNGGRVEAVGWSFEAFADNSVVCHAHRHSGGMQDTFIGGGGLAVRVHEGTPFFPNVYNEDWLFLHDLVAQGRVLLAGGLCQLPYDPFDDHRRARHQEFGDLFAESVFTLMHHPAPRPVAADALETRLEPARDPAWWAARIRARHAFISAIAVRGRDKGWDDASPVMRSLDEACLTLGNFSPRDLVDYTVAWRRDLRTWQTLLSGLDTFDLATALDLLGLTGVGDVQAPWRARFTGRVSAGSRAPSRP
jgi:hypothetical protein